MIADESDVQKNTEEVNETFDEMYQIPAINGKGVPLYAKRNQEDSRSRRPFSPPFKQQNQNEIKSSISFKNMNKPTD